MVRLLHLSDLHFGREIPALIPALISAAGALAPDLTVVSGDLTQRARAGQFARAAALMAALPGPVLAVPGNHDVPLWNLAARMLWPWRAWRRGTGRPLAPRADLPGLRVVGVNTADPHAWERGRLSERALDEACARLSQAAPGALRVVALHHPLKMPPGTGKAPMPGADEATEALSGAGADLVLCGHLHRWAAEPHALHQGSRALLCVQAGTTLSSRLRGEENDFNLIEYRGGVLSVTRWSTNDDDTAFVPGATHHFHATGPRRSWQALPDPLSAPPPAKPPLTAAPPIW